MELLRGESGEEYWTLSQDFVKEFKEQRSATFKKHINVSWKLSGIESSNTTPIFTIYWRARYGQFFHFKFLTEFDIEYEDFENEETQILNALVESYGFAQMHCNEKFPIKNEKFHFPLLNLSVLRSLQLKISLYLQQQLL